MALFVFPGQGLAVEFSIDDVEIEAWLLEDGNVEVKETHTYSFDGDFGGITREIAPKEGSSITNFTAEENGKPLKIENEDHLYKIHRKGEDEVITIDLAYTIKNGVDVYSDLAEFYWPFFDDRNESTYENMNITVHPPKETKNVIAFGYDEAFETENIQSDGSVIFTLGEVPSDENGDIRVAYDAALFPSAAITADKPIKNEILKAHADLINAAIKKLETKDTLNTIGKIGIPAFTLILLILMISTFMKARLKKADVQREAKDDFSIPKEEMSLPATIFFTNGGYLPAEAMAAGLLDLVRKGIVEQLDQNVFVMKDTPKKLLKHEQILIDFLFHEVGENGKFTFDNLASYTKASRNHNKYQQNQIKWSQAVKEEMKEKNLYENSAKFRWTVGLSSLLVLPFIILFPIYDLLGWFMAALLLFITTIFYALFYHPKTRDGLKISYEWNAVKKFFKEMTVVKWNELSADDKMRAYLYGLGINNKGIVKKNEELVKSFERPLTNTAGHSDPAGIYAMTFIGPVASTNFHSASQNTQSSSSSSSSTSGGGGVGGGGGGSGAF